MLKVLVVRTLRLLATVVLVLGLSFVFLRLSGTPVERMFPEGIDPEVEAQLAALWGLDRPWLVQFVDYVGKVLQGDFGRSLLSGREVVETYLDVLAPTLWLGGLALALSIAVGLPIGIYSALRRGRSVDRLVNSLVFLAYALPGFVVALLLTYVFGYQLNWLPTIGADTAWHYVLPVSVLALGTAASLARYTRGAMLDELGQEYIRTALAKGLPRAEATTRHGLRNALIPVVTVIGMELQAIVNGSFIIETLFAWPGVGRIFIGAVKDSDYPVFQFGVLFYAAVIVVINYFIDLCYLLLDPRVRVDA
jgi:peptide/nickel transport system permease protein